MNASADQPRGEWLETRPGGLPPASRASAVVTAPGHVLLFGGRAPDGRYAADPFSAALDGSVVPPPNPVVSLNATAVSPSVIVVNWQLPYAGVRAGSVRIMYRRANNSMAFNTSLNNATLPAGYNVTSNETWRDAQPLDARGSYSVLEGLQPGTPYQIVARSRAPACGGGRLESGPVSVIVWTPLADERPTLACPAPNVTLETLECIPRGAVSIAGVLMPNISELAGLDPKELDFRQWPPAGTLLLPAYDNVTNQAYPADVARQSSGRYEANFTWALRQHPEVNASCAFTIAVADLYVPSVCQSAGGSCPPRNIVKRIPEGQARLLLPFCLRLFLTFVSTPPQCSVPMEDLRPQMTAKFQCERAYSVGLVQSIPPGAPLTATGAPQFVHIYTEEVPGVADRFGLGEGPACTSTILVERSSAPKLSVGGAFANVNGTDFLVLGCRRALYCPADDGTTPLNANLSTIATPTGTVTLAFEYNATDACEEPACEVGVVVLDDGATPAGLLATDRDNRALTDSAGLGMAPAAELRMGGDGSLVAAVRETERAGERRRTKVEFSTLIPGVLRREFEVHVQCSTAAGGKAASAWVLELGASA
eukprot:tig00000269_g23753.t1